LQSVPANTADQTVFVCYFDGQFNAPMGPSPMTPGATVAPPYNRARVLVDASGAVTGDAFGRHDTSGYADLPIEAPPSG
jgi:hypothetical protein